MYVLGTGIFGTVSIATSDSVRETGKASVNGSSGVFVLLSALVSLSVAHSKESRILRHFFKGMFVFGFASGLLLFVAFYADVVIGTYFTFISSRNRGLALVAREFFGGFETFFVWIMQFMKKTHRGEFCPAKRTFILFSNYYPNILYVLYYIVCIPAGILHIMFTIGWSS